MKQKYVFLTIILLILISGMLFYFQKHNSEVKHAKVPIREQTDKRADEEYKFSLIKSLNMKIPVKSLESVMGPSEIEHFILSNNFNFAIYTPSNTEFRANLHMHTTASDGKLPVEELLIKAENHAKATGKIFHIAITDHNTMEGAKKALKIIAQNPQAYKHIKVILGMEVYSTYFVRDIKMPVGIHILSWGINPYDKELNNVFYKRDPNDKYNFSERTFEDAIKLLNRKGLVGIAHPARYIEELSSNINYSQYFNTLFKDYTDCKLNHVPFVEGYYQSYTTDTEFALIGLINHTAREKNIVLTGSTDAHGNSLFRK